MAQLARQSARPWPPPLDRKVSISLREMPLREALDRLAAAARLRFSYSDELLPLDRPVCVSFRELPVGAALAQLLAGVAVSPVAAGGDQVILAPVRDAGPDTLPSPTHVIPLDRIVVKGRPSAMQQRELPFAVSVVDRRALDAGATGTLTQIMDASVPGMWMWEQPPGSVLASFAGIRGASAFGVTAPKVYLDGIELANPLLLSQLAPGTIERIEVIRGPQAAALYGGGALNGVVNIISRRAHLEPGLPRRHVQSTMGMTESTFAPGGTLTQEHALALDAGSDVRSAGLDLAIGSSGAFLPGAFSRHVSLDGNARLVGSRTLLTGTVRLFAEDAGAAISPLLRGALPTTPVADSGGVGGARLPVRDDSSASPQKVREYTLGGTATFMQNPHWTHTLTLGVDGYRLAGAMQELSPVTPLGGFALNSARGGADRGTLRLSSVGRFGDADHASATLTFAAEESLLRDNTAWPAALPAQPSGTGAGEVQWQNTTAAVAQAQAALHGSLFLTAGLRAERDAGLAGQAQTALLPALGLALAHDAGPLTVRVRAAVGRGIQAPLTPVGGAIWGGLRAQVIDPALQPERQSGVEAGLDLSLGDIASLHVTRYDQIASGLLQPVSLPLAGAAIDAAAGTAITPGDVAYTLQDLGAITNRGWELQASTHLAYIWLAGTLSHTDSRVSRTAVGYTGDLRPGDRMLGVPAWTGSLTASWTLAGWSTSIAAYRACDWIDYDRLALARLAADGLAGDLTGASLRGFWRRYDGITHLRATASRRLGRGLTLLVSGDNLLDQQVGEPDDITVLPGRTVSIGLKAAF